MNLSPHRNAAATVAIARASPFTLRLCDGEGLAETRLIALIAPNTHHHLVPAGPMVFIYLDSLSDDYKFLSGRDLDEAYPRLVASLDGLGESWDVDELCGALGVPARATADPRVARAIRQLDVRPQDFPRVADLAAVADLSPSHFQALFSRAVGMPFRRYRLWRRMAVVLRSLRSGATLTDAAFDAGFSGSGHLSASFRNMFGLTPSALLAFGVALSGDA